jgi:hypothetical protein
MVVAPARASTSPEIVRQSRRSWTELRSPAALLALGLGAAVVYAAFASGAIELPMEARLEVGVAALSLLSLAALLFGRGMRISASMTGWAGLALLTLLAIWTGLSIAWSIAPDNTWTELNRVLAYTLITATALAIGSSLPRAAERTAQGYLLIAAVVALYALGGKAIPAAHIPGIDLNHTAFFSRLRAPLAYWNALSLFCVLAVPIAVQAAADPARPRRPRVAALVALVLLLTTIGLTYSRGGVAALAVALVVLLAMGPDRLRTAAVAAAGVIGAAPALAVGFTRSDLTHDLVPLARRTDDGLLFAAALVLGAIAAVFIEGLLERRADRVVPTAVQRRRAVAIAGIGAVVAVALVVGGLAASSRGLAGSVTHGFDSFTSVKFERQNDPARILQTNSGNRWVWWSEAVGAWADRPLGGWGAGSFPLLHHRYRHNGLEVLQPHSVPLQFLAEVGLIGALVGLGALGLLAAAGWRRVAAGARAARAGTPPGRDHRYASALFAAVVAWLVHMWFDWDWDIPGVSLPLFAFLGVLAARPLGMPGRALTPPRRGPVTGRRLGALVLGAALACALVVSAVLPSFARDHVQRATEAFAQTNWTEAVRQADMAQRLNPVAVDGLLLEARAAGRRGQFTLASEVLTDAVHRQPDNPDVWVGVARLELARGDIPAMRAAARHILELDPVAPTGRFFFLFNDLGVRSATATGTPLP